MKNFTQSSTIVVSVLLMLSWNVHGQIAGQIPLNPKSIPQFVDPLPHFAGQRIPATANMVIQHLPTDQVAVSTGTVLATGTVGITPNIGKAHLWAYSISNDGGTTFTVPHWPAFTIVARQGIPVNVTYENKLDAETYASVNLIADQTLHWAAPGGMNMMNMDPYTGPVPVVPHLHGGEVASESDGGPDAWFTPNKGYTGPSWGIDGTDENYHYPNLQEAATLWWHDHALGATRLNVYAGLAGFYFLKGGDEENAKLPGWSGDDLVKEVLPPGKSGVFNPIPYLPEIEIVFQDRMFDNTGGLYYPNLAPNPMTHPFWTPEFVGDVMTVNGKTWPYLSVAPRKYRFRLLNGSNARFYEIWLQDLVTGALGPQIVQIGTDGGLLDAPVPIPGKLLLSPGERADVVIDFSASAPNQVWTLRNSANTPYPKGGPPNGSTTGRIMQFIVNGQMVSAANPATPGTDKSALPTPLRAVPLVRLTNFAGTTNVVPDLKRQLTLNEVMGMGGPLEVLVNNTKWDANGMTPGLGETELPKEGTTELWQIINLTADAHPIHLHLVQFQIVSRQAFNTNKYNKLYNASFPQGLYIGGYGPPKPYDFFATPPNTPPTGAIYGGNPDITPYLQGLVKPAKPNEQGWKDTHVVMPGEVTTFIVRFAPTDKPINALPSDLVYPIDPGAGPGYVWHCHIIDHEDNEMMRPYKVVSSLSRGTAGALKSSSLFPVSALKGATISGTLNKLSEKISGIVLEQNYPNPFSGVTEIRFTLPETAPVKLTLFNSIGVEVKTLIDAEAPAGLNTVRLDAGDLKAGVYFYKLNTGVFTQIKKMIIQN